jgi:hypothetical protein
MKMAIPMIQVQPQLAILDINTMQAKLSIEQPGPELDLEQPPAEMHIEKTPSKLTIDQTQAWADMGMKPWLQFNEDIANSALQDCWKGIQCTVNDGDEMMRIEDGGNPIADISKRNGEKPVYDFTTGVIPSYGSVKIDYEPAKLNITWNIKQAVNNTKARAPIIQYTPGNVSIQLKQYPSIKIDFKNIKYVGLNYEQEI